MKRVSKELKELMIQMKKEGLSSYAIAKILNFSQATVHYHTDKKYQENVKEKARKNNSKWVGRKNYIAKYMTNRYNTDPEFRERVKKANRENQRKRYAKIKEERKNDRKKTR